MRKNDGLTAFKFFKNERKLSFTFLEKLIKKDGLTPLNSFRNEKKDGINPLYFLKNESKLRKKDGLTYFQFNKN